MGTDGRSTIAERLQRVATVLREGVEDLVDPADAHTRTIRLEQLKLAARNSDASLAKIFLISTVIAGGLAAWSPWAPLAIWWALINLAVLATRRLLVPYVAGLIGPSDLKSASIRFFWVNLGQMVIFVSIAPIGYPVDEPMGQALVMLVLAATMASVAPITGPCRVIFFSDMAPVCIAAVLTPPVLSGWSGVPASALAMLFAFLILDSAKGAYRLAEDALRLNDQNEELIARLRASDKAKSEFLANMSHELRTPLNAILGFSEVMKDELVGPIGSSKYKSYAGDIHASGQHLLGLVNDILDLAKIEAGGTEPADDLLTLSRIVDSSFNLFRIQADRAGVTMRKAVAEDFVVRWDQRAARQIVLNLMSNALKFTPRGGAVTISARRKVDGGAELTFADTGCGIAPELHRKVFEAFGQGRHDLAEKDRGTGLGLAIVKGLVELHGGTLTLESDVGKGAAFTICIPPERVVPVEAFKAAA